MNNISLLLITKNEAENIKKWGSWLPKLTRVNELVVVDSQSTDNTVSEIKKLKSIKLSVKIVEGSADNDFSTQRNLALTHCSNNLILWIDADEKPSLEMIKFINHLSAEPKTNYSFPREDVFLGKQLKHGETANQLFIRLFHKNSGHFTGLVHEIWNSQFSVETTKYPIIHTPNRDLEQFISDINYYSDLRAKELFTAGTKVTIFEIIIYPLTKFFYDYIILLGFLDGTAGIILALSMSFHSFLSRAKLWTLLNP